MTKKKKLQTTKNVHPYWDKSFPNGDAQFKCQKCGALVETVEGEVYDEQNWETSNFHIWAPDYEDISAKYLPRPIIIDGVHFPSINCACKIMDASFTALKQALNEGKAYKGHEVAYDEDPNEYRRSGQHIGYGLVPVSYCPHCGRKVANIELGD